ncbi:MAG: hypothetical protein ACOVMF_00135 [Aquiluna sp.]|jgi:hypothetical protein
MTDSDATLRFGDFNCFSLAEAMAKRVMTSQLLTPVTCLVGIASNVKQWPENRSFISVTKVAKETFLLQLSHFNEVLVVEVTDRHQIPMALGWLEPQLYGGINVPSWHKLVAKPSQTELAQAIVSAFDDLMVTYSHHEANSQNFYLLLSNSELSAEEQALIEAQKEFVHQLDSDSKGGLGRVKKIFTDPKRKDYLGISGDDWDDEIGYLPRFAVLTNHRGFPLVLYKVEVPLFGEPENLKIWNGKQFVNDGELATALCSGEVVQRPEFQLVSSHLVEKFWPGALKGEFR